ncbi:MAG: carboxypeptidase regulatory-like domain-containing protein, partial [Acidobacteria bacterium]|nr:carboxypeptidase regulatory-like domain-containing protein [Acidobacteriota bacterium]
TMTATGGVGPYTFEVVGTLPAGLTLNAATGQITGTPTAAGTFSVRAKDSKGTVSTTSCPFTINPPVNPLTLACPSGKGSVGAPYSSTLAVTGGTGGNVFAIVSGSLPPGLTLNTTTGAITGTPTAAGTFNVKFSVKDSSGTTVYASCSGSCAAVTSFNFTVPAGQLGSTQPYTANGVTLTAYGYNGSGTTGTPRALFGKTAGGNENGLGIYGTSADNEITTSTFIQVDTNDLVAKGATNVQMLIGSVQSGEGYDIYGSNTLGTIGTKLLSGGTSESPFAMPGYGTYRYISVRASAVDVLLNGISFVLPSDCQIVITPALTLTCSSNNTCSEGSSHSSTVTASGGVAPYTFSVATGTIPNGLTLNSSTGAVTGTPTTSGSFTIKVTDSLGTTASNTCPYSVSAKLALGCASSTTGTVGVAFNATITATGGFPGYTFAVATGSLPAGLTLNSATGAITGTPTASGTFTLKVTDSKGNVATSTCSITINPGVSLGSIGDRVWNDPNCLGTQGSGEAGLVGWTVNITGPGSYSATTTTGTNGIYGFPNLPAGTYTVCVVPQSGYVQTYDLNGLSTANCATVTLTSGQNRKDVDFGYRTTSSLGSIGDRVWNDLDGDGVQDSGEGGLKGVKVTIAGPNGYSATTSTASDGSYKFSNLGAGSYTVCVSNVPSGYIQTYDLDGKATAHCATVNLAAAQNRTDVDFGYRCPPGTGSIGNRVWNDVDGNGTQEGSGYGINGVTVTLTGPTNATATTTGDGDYSFVNLPAGAYKVCVSNLPSGYTQTYDLDGLGSASCASLTITSGQVKTDVDFGYWKKTTTGSIGDRVWNDADGDGCQDPTETGLTGWTVKITGPSSYSATATTGTDGAYSFSGLAAGTYAVCVTPQAGFTQTYDRDGLATPNCASIAITAGQNKTDADFGYKASTAATGSIGDRVWDDGNGNGIQESAGNGLNGVKVTITGPNGYTANMLTAGDGNYKFSNLAAGTYTVCTSNLPSGYTQTYDLDGIGSGNCATMTLAGGQARNDVDFGYWKQGTALGSIGDRVWNDASCTGNQGYGEAGLTGWTVKITGPNSYSATATTGSNGTYKFSNLAAGTYTVCVTPQSGFVQTYDLTGLGSANCASIALAAGSNRTDVDFGYRKP